MSPAQVGNRTPLQHVDQQRREVDAGGRGECQRSREARVHLDDREAAVGTQHALDVGGSDEPASLDDVRHDALDVSMAVRAAFHRDAGLDGDPFARHRRYDASGSGRKAVDGEFRTVDRFLDDQIRACARRLVQRMRAFHARGSHRPGAPPGFQVDWEAFDRDVRRVRARQRPWDADLAEELRERELVAGTNDDVTRRDGEPAANRLKTLAEPVQGQELALDDQRHEQVDAQPSRRLEGALGKCRIARRREQNEVVDERARRVERAHVGAGDERRAAIVAQRLDQRLRRDGARRANHDPAHGRGASAHRAASNARRGLSRGSFPHGERCRSGRPAQRTPCRRSEDRGRKRPRRSSQRRTRRASGNPRGGVRSRNAHPTCSRSA